MTNLKEQSNNANVNANELAETVSASLDKSQKNATNTEQSVRQVISMTGEDLHKDTVTAILNDQSIGIEKKIELVHSENADYDSRLGNNTSRVEQLQSTQTRNVGAIIKWCGAIIKWCSEHWIWLAIAGTVGIGAVTPPGRRMIATAAGKVKALPV